MLKFRSYPHFFVDKSMNLIDWLSQSENVHLRILKLNLQEFPILRHPLYLVLHQKYLSVFLKLDCNLLRLFLVLVFSLLL